MVMNKKPLIGNVNYAHWGFLKWMKESVLSVMRT